MLIESGFNRLLNDLIFRERTGLKIRDMFSKAGQDRLARCFARLKRHTSNGPHRTRASTFLCLPKERYQRKGTPTEAPFGQAMAGAAPTGPSRIRAPHPSGLGAWMPQGCENRMHNILLWRD